MTSCPDGHLLFLTSFLLQKNKSVGNRHGWKLREGVKKNIIVADMSVNKGMGGQPPVRNLIGVKDAECSET